MPKFSIIIPVCDNLSLTEKCIRSIKNYSSDYELIIIDNGSKIPYQGEGKIIRNKMNAGYPIAINQGLREAQGQILILLNNDTIVSPGWLENFEKHLEKYDIVGPVSNNVSGIQKIESPEFKEYKDFNNFSIKIKNNNQNKIIPFYRLVFFCVAIKREVIDKIGFLDEDFTPGNFEDDDYCLRAIEANFKLGIAEDIFIYHKGSATHKSLNLDFENIFKINQAKFNTKYPHDKYNELCKKAFENSPTPLLNPKSPITLVMIVKNEAKGLERAILSARGLVSSIIIAIDNQTIDQTAKIAEIYATEIKYFTFDNDFSKARNFAQEGVKTEWVLFLDGHEYIKQAPNLDNFLKENCDGLLCTVEMDNGSQFRNPRLIKKNVKFAGAIHEQQLCSKIIPYLGFIIKHDRINSQSKESFIIREAQRNIQMPEIMGRLIKENPKDTRSSFHLFLYYIGRQKFKQAKIYQKLFLKYSKDSSDRWFVFFNIALSFLMRKKYFKAYMAARSAEQETPGRWEIKKLIGIILYEQKNYEKALEYLVDSFQENECDSTFKPWVRDFAGLWNLIGECFFNLGQFYKAGESFKNASQQTEKQEFKELFKNRSELMFEMSKSQRSG